MANDYDAYGDDEVRSDNPLRERTLMAGQYGGERYGGKTHLTITKCADFLRTPPKYIPDGEFCEPPQAMPDKYKVPGCSITAYWNYYEGEKYTVANADEMLITRPKEYEKKNI